MEIVRVANEESAGLFRQDVHAVTGILQEHVPQSRASQHQRPTGVETADHARAIVRLNPESFHIHRVEGHAEVLGHVDDVPEPVHDDLGERDAVLRNVEDGFAAREHLHGVDEIRKRIRDYFGL